MFNHYHPNIKATIGFLRLLKVNVNHSTVNKTLQNHPDWPSLLCISDALSKWRINNGAAKIDPNQIQKLPTPFIANTNDPEMPISIVTDVTNETVQVYQKNYNKTVTQSLSDFLQKWDGVYLIAEPNANSGEPNYKRNKRKAFLDALIPLAAFLASIALSLLLLRSAVRQIEVTAFLPVLHIYLQYLIMMVGVGITSLLIWYEVDKNNPLLNKVCTGIVITDCTAILSGKRAKVFKWLSWSEIGFFYYVGSLLSLLFYGSYFSYLFSVLAWINVLAFPFIVYSIYYQWIVAKQWCLLCLAIQVLLGLGGINVISSGFLFPFPQLSVSLVGYMILLYLLPAFLWYSIKPYILNLQEFKNVKQQYLRTKFDTKIFESLLMKQPPIVKAVDGIGIELGNPTAKNTLIKVCNPYCGPCSKAHPKIEKLLQGNVDLKVKIIFNVSDNDLDSAVKPVRHLLAIAEKGNDVKLHKALDDWYLPNRKDYEAFATKYPMNGELLQQRVKISLMEEWCASVGIKFTPTIFLNGYQLPNSYNIDDLEYFLSEYPALGKKA